MKRWKSLKSLFAMKLQSRIAYYFGSNHDIFNEHDDLYQYDYNGGGSGFGQDACGDDE